MWDEIDIDIEYSMDTFRTYTIISGLVARESDKFCQISSGEQSESRTIWKLRYLRENKSEVNGAQEELYPVVHQSVYTSADR